MSGQRDPRKDPKPGDVLEKTGKRLIYVRRVRRFDGAIVFYQDGIDQVCASTLRNFSRWAKNAEIVHVAD